MTACARSATCSLVKMFEIAMALSDEGQYLFFTEVSSGNALGAAVGGLLGGEEVDQALSDTRAEDGLAVVYRLDGSPT